MISMIEDKMPHAHIFSHLGKLIPEKLDKENIRHAYEDLTTAYKGVIDFVRIIDGLGDDLYSPQELIVAGIFMTEALDGVLIKEGITNGIDNFCEHKDKSFSFERSKYIRINGLDMILSMYDYRVLLGEELAGFKFDGDNGKFYKLRIKRVENSEVYAGSSHANDRPQKDE